MTTTTVTIGNLYRVGTRRTVWVLESVDQDGIADLRAPGTTARKSARVTSLVEVDA